jgi:acetolactate synthase-1/2/3 large subunit
MLDYPVRHVLVRHEQGAAHMADGFARASGEVGVAIATSGPGATNLVTGIATAQMDSSPLVCITGQVPSKLIGYDAFQETDISGITLPITKHSYLVTRVDEIMPTIKEAFYLAKSGRPGPVLVDITKDAQQASTDWTWNDAPVKLRGYQAHRIPAKSDMTTAIELIKAARKPLILAGQGVIQSNAMKELRAFAEMIDAPVALTLLGLGGFPASHSLNIGMMGMHGEAWVNHAIQEADLLLALGMRFDDRVTGNLKTYAPHAKKIHIDIDPSEINKNVRADAAIVADLRETLRELLDMIEAFKSRPVVEIHRIDERRHRGPRYSAASRQRSPVRGARHQRHLAAHQRQRHHRHRRRPASDVGSAVLPP